MVRGLPIVEHVVQLRIQTIGGGIPWLQEEIVNIRFIDGADRGAGIGISGQQGTFCLWIDAHCLLEKFNAIHARHALVSKQQGNTVIAHFHLFQQIERALGGVAADDSIFRSILRTQIALNGPQNI